MYASPRIDLAHRKGDGIDVTLWWSPEDDLVAALRYSTSRASRASRSPSTEPEPSRPSTTLFAYAAHKSPESLDVAA